jgi:hypothetical protein
VAELDGAELRRAYVDAVQRLVQLQCDALVNSKGVSPELRSVVARLWLGFIASTDVLSEDFLRWAPPHTRRHAHVSLAVGQCVNRHRVHLRVGLPARAD